MAWRSAKNANQRAWHAARRAKGLCINCPLPSPRYWRCLCCRIEHREANAKAEKLYKRAHRREINARARAVYAASVGRPVRVYRHHGLRRAA